MLTIADAFSSFGNDDQISFNDNINLSGSLTSSGTITASALFTPVIRFSDVFNSLQPGQFRLRNEDYGIVSASDFSELSMLPSGAVTLEVPETFHIGILKKSSTSALYNSQPYTLYICFLAF